MLSWVKRILLTLVVTFAGFYIFTRPEQAAQAVKTFLGAFDAVARFFTELATR